MAGEISTTRVRRRMSLVGGGGDVWCAYNVWSQAELSYATATWTALTARAGGGEAATVVFTCLMPACRVE